MFVLFFLFCFVSFLLIFSTHTTTSSLQISLPPFWVPLIRTLQLWFVLSIFRQTISILVMDIIMISFWNMIHYWCKFTLWAQNTLGTHLMGLRHFNVFSMKPKLFSVLIGFKTEWFINNIKIFQDLDHTCLNFASVGFVKTTFPMDSNGDVAQW